MAVEDDLFLLGWHLHRGDIAFCMCIRRLILLVASEEWEMIVRFHDSKLCESIRRVAEGIL